MTSLKAARTALATQITAVLADPDVDVLPYEPATVSGATVAVATGGIEATEWVLFIRVYVPATQPQESQDRVDDLAEAIDAADNLSVIPRGGWVADFDEAKTAFVMTMTVGYPRDDF